MIPTHVVTLIFWTLLVIFLSVLPSDKLKNTDLLDFDKAGHFFLYTSWTYFVIFSLIKDYFSGKRKAKIVIGTFIASSVLGILMEIVQNYLTHDRKFDFLDIVANFLGSLFGIILFLFLKINRL